jgi:hypothetical protein
MTKEEFEEFDALFMQADKSQQEIKNYQDKLIDYCNKLVTEVYGDQLLSLESAGYRELDNKIIRMAGNLAVEVNNIFFHNTIEE